MFRTRCWDITNRASQGECFQAEKLAALFQG
jgi:hypothetical protein